MTRRTQFELRVTTAPADLGYGGKPSPWLEWRPDCRGTAHRVLAWLHAAERSWLSGGVYYGLEIRRCADNLPVPRSAIQGLLNETGV